MRIKQKFLLVLISVLSFISVNAQDETISVETDLVTVNVAVTDKQGNSVKNLKQEQFEVFDNKTKQRISHFSAESAPVTFGIVYDMHPTTAERTAAVLDSLRAFTKELSADDRFFIVAFNERGSLSLDFIPTIEQIEKNLPAGVKQREPNSLYDAIYLATNKLRESKNLKRTLLVISDSADHNSRHSFSDLSKQLKSFDAQIYAVIFDESDAWNYSELTRAGDARRKRISNDANNLDRAALEELTLKTGGTSHFPANENRQRLYSIYRQIASEMRDFYSLSFYPTGAADGKWHEIKIKLRPVENSKGAALTYRQGYQSPSPKR
jgi:Ca-activated chloride channel family protein